MLATPQSVGEPNPIMPGRFHPIPDRAQRPRSTHQQVVRETARNAKRRETGQAKFRFGRETGWRERGRERGQAKFRRGDRERGQAKFRRLSFAAEDAGRGRGQAKDQP